MKLIVSKKHLSSLPEQFLRERAAYAHIHSHHTGHDSYVRRLTRDHYPRLHMYIKDLGENVEFNLHLDQKQASYGGSHMHNAEYDGEVVAGEIARIKDLLRLQLPGRSQFAANSAGTGTAQDRVGHGDYHKPVSGEDKDGGGFWKSLFG